MPSDSVNKTEKTDQPRTNHFAPMIEVGRVCLASYGIMAFVNHPLPALLIFLATFYHPVIGLMGLLGSLISTLTARWVGAHPAAWRSGVHGVSGMLIGLAIGMYAQIEIKTILFTIIGTASVGVISTLLGATLAKHDLPILSLPFMLMIYPVLISVGVEHIDSQSYPAIAFLRDIDVWLFSVLPLSLFEFIKMFGNILFQENLISGVLVLLGIGLWSRISLGYALWGGLLGLGTYYFLHGSLDGFHGLNYVLTALAFGGFFLVANHNAFYFASLAIVTVGLVDYAAFQFLNPETTLSLSNLPSAIRTSTQAEKIPTLVFAFNVVTLAYLFPLKIAQLNRQRSKLVPVPLELIKNPETNIRLARRWEQNKYIQKTRLSFPFLGSWVVFQGHNGEWTHKAKGKYAWDFVVEDEQGQMYRNAGLNIEDYYCFGLPVFAPAPGTIVRLESDVEDNPPGTAVTERNWGNYVIIDHGNGEFSEISHFKKGSITVGLGAVIQRGQLLGYCGNSGRSPVPHIHFQLQDAVRPGSESLPACFAESIVNNEIRLNTVPEKNDILSSLDIDAEAEWGLLGREEEIWEFSVRLGMRRFTEILYFVTDVYGMPSIVSKNQHQWYILDKPHFVQLSPDFKTFPTLLAPSGWVELIGDALFLPKTLTTDLHWENGEILDEKGKHWTIKTNGRKIVIDVEKNVILSASIDNKPDFELRLIRRILPNGSVENIS
ncbi:urea transporter [bacterium]|nr:urea transporter [bacterium]